MEQKKMISLIFEDGNDMEVVYGTTVRDIIKKINNPSIIGLRVNGLIVPADHELTEDSYITYISINDRTGEKIYVKGLEFVYIKAIKEIFGKKTVINIKHSLDKGIYTEISTAKRIDSGDVKRIKNRMKEIIDEDHDFKIVSVTRNNAIDYVKSLGEDEKLLIFTYQTSDSVTMYELDGYFNYFFFIMPPSTKMLNKFELTFLAPNGILLQHPVDGVIPKYNPTYQVLNAFKTYEKKLMALGVKYVGELNKLIVDNKISDFIQMNEILYDQNLENIAYKIYNDRKIKSIFISGPSSSGKTTTSKKLALYLKSFGIDTLVLSTDDYFVERVDSPRKEDGSYEYEIVDAIDYKLFSKQVNTLLKGEEVIPPKYNFITGKKEFDNKPIKLGKNQVLIVEGLHAINDKLNGVIDKKHKLKMYISPFMPVALDRHNHIQTTDLRLIRRMVRDYNHRGYTAEETLTSWQGMRGSERDYIYPYQREADIVVNTALGYEIGVLKTYVEPLLYSISKESPYYEEAIRILKFLRIFMNIPGELVPEKSVLREFIGNSYFE